MSILPSGEEPRKPLHKEPLAEECNSQELKLPREPESPPDEVSEDQDESNALADEAIDHPAGEAQETPWNDEDEVVGEEDYFDPWDAAAKPDAKAAVERWRIVAVGKRPEDYMARDLLYGALLRDRRVPWFKKYLKHPPDWMKELVKHIPTESARHQALQFVVLDFLHKSHLARLLPRSPWEYDEDDPESLLFQRLWRCVPYTVQLVRRNRAPIYRGCGYPRLCPWCYARKVVELYRLVRKGPLKETAGKYLLLGKPTPFTEPRGGLDGRWEHADFVATTSDEEVRGHSGRYFGLWPERVAATRKALTAPLLRAANELGANGGIVAHQLGSAQLSSGHRTLLHDLGLVAEVTAKKAQTLTAAAGSIAWTSQEQIEKSEGKNLVVQWLLMPADHRSTLRVCMAGSSFGYAQAAGIIDESVKGQYPRGIAGALSWQPTFLLDDHVWFPYVELTRRTHLYRSFGNWPTRLTEEATNARLSIDRKFKKTQHRRHIQARQQKGNLARGRQAEERRKNLLNLAQKVWDQVVAEGTGKSGRPNHRKRLGELLRSQCGVASLSYRDLQWLMKRLRSQ